MREIPKYVSQFLPWFWGSSVDGIALFSPFPEILIILVLCHPWKHCHKQGNFWEEDLQLIDYCQHPGQICLVSQKKDLSNETRCPSLPSCTCGNCNTLHNKGTFPPRCSFSFFLHFPHSTCFCWRAIQFTYLREKCMMRNLTGPQQGFWT